ncbi:MAG: DUF362 domain-containing protein [Bacteroidales bacterium]|jgi:uncharacterized protein (DUF362 family)|nr:DUF362 domain-containing protein [Bacteroidales bacterium]
MKRRDFIRKSAAAAALTGAAISLPFSSKLISSPSHPSHPSHPYHPSNPSPYDLVAIKGGEVEAMFDQAIAAMGGMQAFVKKGQKVVVKPNIGWDVSPERAGNTNPALVKRIVRHCLDAGAREVYVFDNTCDKWDRCYATSGIEQAVKDAGGKLAPGNTENYYQEVQIPNGKKLKSTKVHELILDSDVFINVPVLKSHGSARLTISMKNLMGVVWDRGYWHRNDLNQCIADYATYLKKPTLNIIDAYRVMMKNGPRGVSEADVSLMKSLIISPDMVAADAAATKMFGISPDDVPYIGIADSMGIGSMALDKLNVHRIIL